MKVAFFWDVTPCSLVYYLLKCQRDLLPVLPRLCAAGSNRFLWYTSTGLQRVTLQKALKLEPTVFFIVFGHECPGALRCRLNF